MTLPEWVAEGERLLADCENHRYPYDPIVLIDLMSDFWNDHGPEALALIREQATENLVRADTARTWEDIAKTWQERAENAEAALEELRNTTAPLDQVGKISGDLMQRAEAAEAKLERVRKLHPRADYALSPGHFCPTCQKDYPCATLRVTDDDADD